MAEVGSGGRCQNDDNCPDGERCGAVDGPPTCAPLPAVGEPCPFSFCPEGSECADPDGEGTATCIAQGGDGEPCAGVNCLPDHYCDTGGAEDVCVAFHAENESCLASGVSDEVRCQDGLLCVITGQNVDGWANAATCLPPPAAQGDPCRPSFEDPCPEGLYCQRPGYTCQPPEDAAAQCSAAAPARSCGEGYFCGCDGTDCGGFTHGLPPEPNELCTARKADGETCTSHFECVSDYCAGTCREAPGPGGIRTDLCW